MKVASPKGLEDDDTITMTVIVGAIVEANSADAPRRHAAGRVRGRGRGRVLRRRTSSRFTKDELGKNVNRLEATQRVGRLPRRRGDRSRRASIRRSPTIDAREADRPDAQPARLRPLQRPQGAVSIGLTPADPATIARTGLHGDDRWSSSDPFRSFLKVDSDVWYREVADGRVERWSAAALQRPTSLEQVSSVLLRSGGRRSPPRRSWPSILTLLGILDLHLGAIRFAALFDRGDRRSRARRHDHAGLCSR